jgi:2-alkyl-3-oxoalkanoate reductase
LRALVLPEEEAGTLERSGVEIRQGDLTKEGSLAGLCDGVDIVFHLAGRVIDRGTRREFYRAILEAKRNLLEEAAGEAARFLYVSSIAALGMGRHLNGMTETGAALMSGVPYGDANLQAEWLVHGFTYSGKIDCTIVRPANVIGPGSAWVRDIIDRYRALSVPLIDEGRHSASLVSVDNLVDGIILAAPADEAVGKLYHLRDDWEVTWKRYLTDLGAMIGKHPPPATCRSRSPGA